MADDSLSPGSSSTSSLAHVMQLARVISSEKRTDNNIQVVANDESAAKAEIAVPPPSEIQQLEAPSQPLLCAGEEPPPDLNPSPSPRLDNYADVKSKGAVFFDSIQSSWPSRPRSFVTYTAPHERRQALSVLSSSSTELQSLWNNFHAAYKLAEGTLNAQRNALAAVNTLPENVLLRIFEFSVLYRGKTLWNTPIHISRACAYWQAVAVKSPGLWTTLDLLTLSCAHTTLYVANSRDRPLTVTISDDTVATYCATWKGLYDPSRAFLSRLSFCESILPRIEELQLDFHANDEISSQWLATAFAPKLRVLKLVQKPSSDADPDSQLRILPSLFAGGVPRLHDVVFMRIFVPWSSLARATALTQLYLDFSKRPDTEESVEEDTDLAMIFDACYKLEALTLICHDPLRGYSHNLDEPVHLPQLDKLHVDLMTPDVGDVLQSVCVPRTVSSVFLKGRLDRRPKKNDCVLWLPEDPRCLPSLSQFVRLNVNIRKHTIKGWFSFTALDESPLRSPDTLIDIGDETMKTESQDEGAVVTFSIMQKYYIMPHLTQLIILDLEEPRIEVSELILFLRHSLKLEKLVVKSCDPSLLDKFVDHWTFAALPLCPTLLSVELHVMPVKISALERFCQVFFKAPKYGLLGYKRRDRDENIATQKTTLTHEHQSSKLNVRIGQGMFILTEDEKRVVDVVASNVQSEYVG